MRVLWFSVTPSLYDSHIQGHNGGGWIIALEKLLKQDSEIKLGVAFEHKDQNLRKDIDGVTYYTISDLTNADKINRLKSKFTNKIEEQLIIPRCLDIINDFKPDIIHIFGSEWCFGLLSYYTSIKIVIHMQGFIPAYDNAHYPPNYNIYSEIINNKLKIKSDIGLYLSTKKRKQNVNREEKILYNCNFFMGRTEWDRKICKLYNPKANYFYCSEALRESFIDSVNKWKIKKRTKLILITVCSSSLLKGIDVILKTAKLLKENSSIDFEWRLLGPKSFKMIESQEKINSKDVNVYPLGVVSANRVVQEILDADIFIHPSYIDNSPNAICEAQYLGIPVIATNVGGIPSLITHNETGLLFGANDPYSLASNIIELYQNKEKMLSIGNRGQVLASNRHNPLKIIADLKEIYRNIISK